MRKYRFHKKSLVVFAVLYFLSAPASPAALNNFSVKKTDHPPMEAPLKSFTVGEKLVYDVYWLGFSVGTGSLEVKEKATIRGREVYHVIAIAQTNNFLSKIYPIHDEIHSFIDAKEFYSVEFHKTLQEGRYRADEKMVFDHEAKKAFYESLQNKTKKEITIPASVQDFLSAFYWYRLQEIQVAKSIHTMVSSDEKNWDLEIQVLRQEKKEIRKKGGVETVVVEPKTKLKGALYRRGRATVYYTIDARRVPLWISLSTPFGPVNGILKS